MVIEIVLSGAVSAILGAVSLKFVEKYWYRRQLLKGVYSELHENYERATAEIEIISESEDWSERLVIPYKIDNYQLIRTSDPGLYLRMENRCPRVQGAYALIEHIAEEQKQSRKPGAKFDQDEDAMICELDRMRNLIEEAERALETEFQSGAFTGLIYGSTLESSKEKDPKVVRDSLSELEEVK